ncbi:PAS domain-containing sensor histidine kinase [Ramlibacter sp. USB13]|uniref:histidine kinase n=1 Tax=Ramlibacter cellulosilyticus TaxID=2764187 RepID=A0A923SBI2_9BURK|nr:PAS domain-containing sensor histidine kinase [Ramlibacter cellulosilyticus]MBC5783895.1 PAS domain-containing sensor histidine kinase [Ramlibacter cellulosilyticus]
MDTPLLPGAEALYEAAPCGLLLAAADGRIVGANATLCRWLQYAREDLVGQLRFQELLTMGGRIFWQTHLQPLLRIQASVAEVKLELRRKDASGVPVMVNMAERPWNGGTLLHVAVFLAEDRDKYERELLLQRRRAEELAAQVARDQQELAVARGEAEDRAVFAEQLVGIVSHDIRNPLSVIHMSTALLERGLAPAQQAQAVARVSRAVQRVQRLIADLLDFTQARVGGGLGMKKSDGDLHQAIADSVSELAVAFPARELRHERSGDGRCLADADRIVQAVGNLVANAVSHGDPARPITVRSEGSADRMRVSVHNDGPAIPPELLPRMFEPMVRGAQARAQGVGLGLYIVRAIVQAHGGTVAVQSAAGEGTTFLLEWPRGGGA